MDIIFFALGMRWPLCEQWTGSCWTALRACCMQP